MQPSALTLDGEHMQLRLIRSLALVVTITSGILGCTRISTVAEAVYIPGDAPTEEKLAVAESVGGLVWNGGLIKRVKEAYANLDEDQLAGVFIRWEAISVTANAGDGNTSTGVRIRTGIQSSGGVENAREIAVFCGDIVEEAVSQHFGGAHDIYRIDLFEESLGL